MKIGELAVEEHHLERSHTSGGHSAKELERLKAKEVALDQCWGLPHQRRARRSAGQDPDEAVVQPESTVEGYGQ